MSYYQLKFTRYNNDCFHVSYPDKRCTDDGKGVVGKLEMLQELEVGEQPVSSFAWSPDKTGLGLCTSFDQKVRTVIVTKLNTL